MAIAWLYTHFNPICYASFKWKMVIIRRIENIRAHYDITVYWKCFFVKRKDFCHYYFVEITNTHYIYIRIPEPRLYKNRNRRTQSHRLTNPDTKFHRIDVYSKSIRASIHWAARRLTARSRKVSKPRESGLDTSSHSEIWQAPRQQRCRDACQISKRYYHYNTESRGSETWRDLAVIRLIA